MKIKREKERKRGREREKRVLPKGFYFEISIDSSQAAHGLQRNES